MQLRLTRLGRKCAAPVLREQWSCNSCHVSHRQRMAFASFRTQVEQLVGALEAHGRPFSQTSQAVISISLLKDPLTLGAFTSLTDLPFHLRLAGEEPLSLTEARGLYNSCLLDNLCSIVSRLEWEDFQLDDLAPSPESPCGFTAASSALSCIRELLHAWQRVQPSSDAEAAALESFSRYTCSHELTVQDGSRM